MDKYHLPVYDETKCTLFALGRNAMYAACQILKIGLDDEILTPAFDCDGSLQPFKVIGAKLRFFRSDPHTFAADIGDIKKQINSKTRLIHIINHFGMPQPWDDLLLFRKEAEIPILEDNAYSLFSKYNNKPLGSFGDMSIFSLRKNLPLIDGGLLRVNNPKYSFKLSVKHVPFFYPTEISGIFRIAKTILGYYKAPKLLGRIMKKLNPEIEPPPPLYSEAERGYPDWPLRDQISLDFFCDYLRPMSRLAKMQLSRFSENDYADIAEKKRRYYLWLAEELNDIKGVDILCPKLPAGTVPFCSFLLIESKRDFIFEGLRSKYDVMVWPTLPRFVLDELKNYPEVELLGRKLLQINLPADKVRLPGFSKYLDNLTKDIRSLSEQCFSKNFQSRVE